MREYCLLNEARTSVLNMSMKYGPTEPVLTDYQKEQGYVWVPVQKVPLSLLHKYQNWNERP